MLVSTLYNNNISIAGSTVTVTRPSSTEGDKTVTLTATISKENGTSRTKDLTIVVKAYSALSSPVMQPAIAGNGQVSLIWSVVTEATGYMIYQSTASGSYGLPLVTVSDSVYSYNATGLTNGQTYYFVVKATNPGGDSGNLASQDLQGC